MAVLILISAPGDPVETMGPRHALHLLLTSPLPSATVTAGTTSSFSVPHKEWKVGIPWSLLEWAGEGCQDEEKDGCEVGSVLVGEAKGLRTAGTRNRGREGESHES